MAGAQDVDPVFNSPSSVSVSGKGEATEVTYANNSEHDLFCSGFVGKGRLIADLYDYIKSADVDSALPPTWLKDLADAAERQCRFGTR